MSNVETIERTLREEARDLIVRRVRISLWIGVFALVLFATADIGKHDLTGPVFGLDYLQAAIYAVMLPALRTAWVRQRIVGITLALLLAFFVITALLGILTDDVSTAPLVLISLTTSSAVLYPWGFRPQLALVAAALLAAAWNVGAARVEMPPDIVYSLLALVFASVVSVYVAYEIDRQRRERLVAAEALRRSEERFRLIIEGSTDLIAILDGSGVVGYVSPSVQAALGYAPGELSGRSIFELLHPDDRAEVEGAFQRTVEGSPRNFDPVAFRIRSRDGAWRAVEALGRNLLDEPAVRGVSVIARDVTARMAADAALRESEERVRTMVESALDAVVAIDESGRVVAWNRQAEATFGWSREEAVGRQMSDLIIPPQHREDHARGLRRFLESGVGPILDRRIEITGLHRDGREFPIELSISPNRLGERWLFSAFVRDITERQRAEESLRAGKEAADAANRVKSEFLANMSHEIRTPMNGVIGMTGLLRDTPLTPEQQEYVELIRFSGEALMTIINDVLDFSKIEAGRLELEVVDFDLSTTVAEAVELVAETAQKKGLELAYLVHADVPRWVGGDPGRLRQVLLNLVGNAVKFTERGEVVVRVRLEEEFEQAMRVRFEVSDTGIGISREDVERLFQPFVQVDASVTRKYGGTGLGLSISKRLSAAMGGSMGVVSEPGRGSTFWFVVRLEKRAGREVALPDVSHLRGLRALVVDDNAASREVLRLELERAAGVEVDCVDGAVRALERLTSGEGSRYAVLLVDQRMAGMDGFALARAAKSLPAGERLAIVLLADYGERGDARRAAENGIAAYLTKPVRPTHLLQCVAEVTRTLASPAERRLVTRHTLSEQRALARGRVLVAEDNPTNQRVAALLLNRLGYRAEVVADGQEAVDAVARVPYDAVLMDCQMPRMDGFEAARRIRETETASRVPIIAMTAGARATHREECLAAGMDDYVSKPVTLEALDEVLTRWMPGGGERAEVGRVNRNARSHV